EVVGRVDVYTEITESRRLYTQLLNSEKLRAIGEMASGVAHDFNNLLASILGQVELLHPDELKPPTREAIATIRQSALDGARIVEPFFSTKGPKGSGLGLAVAYSIITRRGGQISVESTTGAGTTFNLNLPYVPIGAPSPAVQPGQRPEAPAARPAQPAPSLTGARILVADDEPGLVAIVRQLMERSGAAVFIAHGGTAALESLRSPGARFDVVI